jgi:hypothetical protein
MQEKHEQSGMGANVDPEEVSIPKESRVSKKISDRITKQVITLVLLMLLILPIFESSFFVKPPRSWDFGLIAIAEFHNRSGFVSAKEEYIDYHDGRRRPIIYLEYELSDGSIWTWEDTDPDDLRRLEKHVTTDDDFKAVFDLREDTRFEAGLNIAKTVFVCIVLTLGAIFFTKDANELVLIPIERMVERV